MLSKKFIANIQKVIFKKYFLHLGQKLNAQRLNL